MGENTITAAIMSGGLVVDSAVFEADGGLELAEQFLADGVWAFENADEVRLLPEYFGIGDKFDGKKWFKRIDSYPETPEAPLDSRSAPQEAAWVSQEEYIKKYVNHE